MLRVVDLGPTAIVTNNDVVFGMARMYSLLAESVGAAAEVFEIWNRRLDGSTRWRLSATK
jgi:hypothetical protein